MTMQGQIDPATIREAIDQARQTARQIGDLQAANARTIRTLEGAFNKAVKAPVNAPITAATAIAEHRRQHRSGVPSRLATDPELETFVRDRIDRLTYKELVAEIAAAFPKDRRVGKSVLCRWSIAQRAIGKTSIT